MQHHTHQGAAPSHGLKVGIGTLAMSALHESMLEKPLDRLDVEGVLCGLAGPGGLAGSDSGSFRRGDLCAVALRESAAKHVSRDQLRQQLERVRSAWPRMSPSGCVGN